jgi:hypothetical protein
VSGLLGWLVSAVAVVAVVSFVAGGMFAYWLQWRSAEQPPAPMVRVGPLGDAYVRLRGNCELGEGFAHVDARGALTVEVLGEDLADAIAKAKVTT